MMLRHRLEERLVDVPDGELLSRARNGDESAFAEIYERHREPVFRFAYRFLSSVSAAEDVTQDCFLSLLRNSERFLGVRASLKTYLLAAARNLSLKKCGRSPSESIIDDDEDAMRSAEREPLEKLLDDELSNVVQAAISSLPEFQREALILFEYEGLSLAEISHVVCVDIGAVKARLRRARQRLKYLLEPYYTSGEGVRSTDGVMQ